MRGEGTGRAGRLGLLALLSVAAALLFSLEAQADGLETIRERGRILVGVKADYPPWGFRNADGALVGMEPDLARDIARRLGVELELVAVTAANRIQMVQQGRVDMLIATMADNAQRRRVLTMVQPHYYASGANILVPEAAGVRAWRDLRGATVCGLQGAYFNRAATRTYAMQVMAFANLREVEMALRDRRCLGWLYDETALAAELRDPGKWTGYEMPLDAIERLPWSIGLPKAAAESRLARFVSDVVGDWHRTGMLMAVEREWGIQPTAYLEDMNAVWNRQATGGDYECHRNDAGALPRACLGAATAPQGAADAVFETIADWFHGLARATGIDLSIAYDAYDRDRLVAATGVTIGLATACIALSVAVGLLGAFLSESRFAPVRWATRAYVAVFRYTPPLVQIFFFYFGIGGLMPSVEGPGGLTQPLIGNFAWAVIALSLYAGAANVEIFRAGFRAVGRELTEAAEALALSRWRTATLVVLPLGVRACLPALNANLVNLVKATGLAYAIAVPELLYVSNQVWSDRGNTTEMMTVLLVLFFAIVSAFVWLMHRLERALATPEAA